MAGPHHEYMTCLRVRERKKNVHILIYIKYDPQPLMKESFSKVFHHI